MSHRTLDLFFIDHINKNCLKNESFNILISTRNSVKKN